MKVYYAGMPLPARGQDGLVHNSIFLAGPTPRSTAAKSWRPEALDLLEEQNFQGAVFVPETAGYGWLENYSAQIRWEWSGLGRAACVLFWVPRELEHMPGFTTNVEFGFVSALAPDRMVLGAPDDAHKMRYLKAMAEDIRAFHENFGSTRGSTAVIPQATLLSACVTLAAGVALSHGRTARS